MPQIKTRNFSSEEIELGAIVFGKAESITNNIKEYADVGSGWFAIDEVEISTDIPTDARAILIGQNINAWGEPGLGNPDEAFKDGQGVETRIMINGNEITRSEVICVNKTSQQSQSSGSCPTRGLPVSDSNFYLITDDLPSGNITISIEVKFKNLTSGEVYYFNTTATNYINVYRK